MLDIVERNAGASRWKHNGPREPGHQLGTIELDNASYLVEHDAMGRVTTGPGTTFEYGPRGRLIFARFDA